ncbi:MAG: hypothetical protein AB8B79_01370 [Granulosicoccus sp.]
MSTAALADWRVLFRFDGSGHHVHSLTKAPTRERLRKSSNLSASAPDARKLPMDLSASERVAAARLQLQPRIATLLWFDADGQWLGSTEVPDPRVAHSPSHIDGVNESYIGLNHGAWLATGPDEATTVTVLFAAFDALALGNEEWHAVMSEE